MKLAIKKVLLTIGFEPMTQLCHSKNIFIFNMCN